MSVEDNQLLFSVNFCPLLLGHDTKITPKVLCCGFEEEVLAEPSPESFQQGALFV